jgi:hypothetical protein
MAQPAALRQPARPAEEMGLRYRAALGLAFLVAGCATLNAGSAEQEKVKVVTERANARWQAIISKDFDAAYGYLSPASRATVSRTEFRTVASRIQYRKADVQHVTCKETVCTVEIELTYDTKMMKGVRTPLPESWVIDKGQAWYVWPL